MNFRKLGLGAVAAVTVVLGSVAATAPAEAASLAFGGSAQFDALTGKFNFHDGYTPDAFGTGKAFVSATTDSFLADLGTSITLKDLTLTTTGTIRTLLSDGTGFITGLKNGVQFNLTEFNFDTSNQKATFNGVFQPLDDASTGSLTSQALIFTTGTSYSVQIVPTPALLPAALGMGVAALRKKRKQEADAELASEPVEA